MSTQTDNSADRTVELPVAQPVFVDPSGRRRRMVRIAAVAAAVAIAGYASMLLIALAGGPVSPHALLPISIPSTSAAPPTSTEDPDTDPAEPNRQAAHPTSAHGVVTTTRPIVVNTTTEPVPTTTPSIPPPPTTTTRAHGPPTSHSHHP